jgi:ArsR family transcriptional regulator, cadmium/lead-responsive transcriptional repressor
MVAPSAVSPGLLATLFRGLADPARLSCLLAVREHPRTVGEIVEETGLSQPNASKHLACLRDCGLVRSDRSGRFVIYQLASPEICNILCAGEAVLEQNGEAIAACPNYQVR